MHEQNKKSSITTMTKKVMTTTLDRKFGYKFVNRYQSNYKVL